MSTGNFPSPQRRRARTAEASSRTPIRRGRLLHPTPLSQDGCAINFDFAAQESLQPGRLKRLYHRILSSYRDLWRALSPTHLAHRELCHLGCRGERVPTTFAPGLNRGEARAPRLGRLFGFLLIALLHRRQLVVHLRLDARALSLQLSDSPNGVIDFLFVIDKPTQG